jgi:hypothetical protein
MKAFNVYNENLERIGTIETWVSLLWEEGYNTLGDFLIEVQQTKEIAKLLKIGNYIGRGDFKTLCLIRSVEVKDKKIIANGHTAAAILKERVSTKVINNQNGEKAMRELVSEMAAWPCVELGELSNLTEKFKRQTSDKTVLEYCEEIAAEIDAGFILRFDKQRKKLLFEVYKPNINKNLIFAAKFGNLSETVYSESENKFKNVAVVAGEGEGENRITVFAGATESEGTARRELYVDARNVRIEDGETKENYRTRLLNLGLEKLAEQIKIQNISVSIDSEDFGTRFGLGDVVTLILDDIGIKIQPRIIGFSYKSQNNRNYLEAEFGTPITRR